MKSKTKTYIWCVILTLVVGGLSALLTMGNMDIYDEIIKGPLAPPAIVFPIVWGILYILMGISLAQVIVKGRQDGIYTLPAIKSYVIQLAVNFFWSIIFFNLRNFLLSFVWLLFLWMLIVNMIVKFYIVNKASAWLNVPYLLWVTFAGWLNFMIYILNK